MEMPPPPPSSVGGSVPEPRGRRTKVGLIALLVVLAVAAAVVVSQMGSGDRQVADDGASGSVSPSAQAPTPPGSARAAAASFKVVVTWAPSSGSLAGYRVYRDGDVLDEVDPGVRSYTDDTVAPNVRYRYEVAAFTEAGDTSNRTVASVKTPPAALALARVQGTFNAKLRLTSSFGLTFSGGGGGPGTLGLKLTPVCGEGPCSVTLGVIGGKVEHFTLKQTAATYSGTGTNRSAFSCGGTPTSASFAVRFTVVAAKSLKDEWRASKLEGTIAERSASQLGCVSSGTDYSFTATLYPA
jgi:hypothetical protein